MRLLPAGSVNDADSAIEFQFELPLLRQPGQGLQTSIIPRA